MRHSHSHARAGFSFVELLVVLALIGILAGIAVPKIRELKRRSYVSMLMTDLRNLANLQEQYWTDRFDYANSLSALRYSHSELVTVTIVEATDHGWSATAQHRDIAITCAVFYGNAEPLAPASESAIIRCT